MAEDFIEDLARRIFVTAGDFFQEQFFLFQRIAELLLVNISIALEKINLLPQLSFQCTIFTVLFKLVEGFVGKPRSDKQQELRQAVDPIARNNRNGPDLRGEAVAGDGIGRQAGHDLIQSEVIGINQMDRAGDQGANHLALPDDRAGPERQAQGTKIDVPATKPFSLVSTVQVRRVASGLFSLSGQFTETGLGLVLIRASPAAGIARLVDHAATNATGFTVMCDSLLRRVWIQWWQSQHGVLAQFPR